MDIKALNLFSQVPQTQGVGVSGKPQSIGGDPASSGGRSFAGAGLFSGQTAGINEAMNGQAVFTTAQAGKAGGVAGQKLNLVG